MGKIYHKVSFFNKKPQPQRVFIMAEENLELGLNETKKSEEYHFYPDCYDAWLGEELIQSYQHALLQATVMSLGCKVIAVESPWKFVRDPVLILPDHRLMIYTPDNEKYAADILLEEGKKLGYQNLKIENAYFEGGNVFYRIKDQAIFHGLNPDGNYFSDEKYIVPTETTNEALTQALSSRGITVYGLELNPSLMDTEVHYKFYYHLDCFMQFDKKRIFILNKKILSDASQELMQKKYGKNFIDLGYENFLTEPVLFNFVLIRHKIKNKTITYAIAPLLKDEIKIALRKLNIIAITPDMLDARNANYDEWLARKVALQLQKKGYETATATNLATHIPKNIFGYQLANGHMPPDIRDGARCGMIEESRRLFADAKVSNMMSLDDFYKNHSEINFFIGQGGPHCLTTDIKNQKLTLPFRKRKTDRFSFFHSSVNLGHRSEVHGRTYQTRKFL